jgi:hypothetical protein
MSKIIKPVPLILAFTLKSNGGNHGREDEFFGACGRHGW